jgi:hypothetical protein
MREYRKLCRELDKLFYVQKDTEKYTHYHNPRSAFSIQQNCIVKLRIGKDRLTHIRFIQEYLPQENKKQVIEKPVLFSNEPVDSAFINNYFSNLADKHFKFIISPENNRVDNTALVKTLVKRMEKITGLAFHWMAAVHTDTNHPHAHLLINGVDKTGKKFRFDKLFITQTMREMNKQICTEMIGKRSQEEIRASILQSYKSYRYCSYDDIIKTNAEPVKNSPDEFQSQITTTNDLILKRLLHLSEMGLAKRRQDSGYIFYLEKDWIKKLKAIGRYNSFLKARSELRTIKGANMELYTKETGEIAGIVTKIYKMNDEESWNHALVVENKKANKAWYIPLYYEPDDTLINAEILCTLNKNQKGLLVPQIIVQKWDDNSRNRNQSI